ncbi:MAG: substrate-binding domain-containing protein [Deltaproteobacteria bacterium]|nr:substrate-binding domain-containing protein [Deltaproteobacteria bacterium]
MKKIWLLVLFLGSIVISTISAQAENIIKMSTTTSTQNSGLLDVLLPEFAKDTGIQIKVFAKGTGAAIRDGVDGNVDIIFVHALAQEEKFVADGYGSYRYAVMHNDFVILGPAQDPARIKGMTDTSQALKKIADAKQTFVSRGDSSGTHIKEQELWQLSGIPLTKETIEVVQSGKTSTRSFLQPAGLGKWYMSIGQGMGSTLTFANEKQGYTLSDRGTYINYKYGRPEGLDLEILCEGDPNLFNPYGILPVNPKKHPHVKFEQADKFAKWLVSEKAQAMIADYMIQGKQAFFPDAIPNAGK